MILHKDPSWTAGLGPVVLWAKIVWKSHTAAAYSTTVDLPTLRGLMQAVLDRAPKSWREVRGPLGAAILSARRVGWEFVLPFVLRTHAGEVILTVTSPKRVKGLASEAWMTRLRTYAAERLGLAPGTDLDLTVLERLLKPGGLSLRAASALRALLVQSIWSSFRLHQAGYDVEPTCPHCPGHCQDTLWHQLFECTKTASLRMTMLRPEHLALYKDRDLNFPLLVGFLALPQFDPGILDGVRA